MPAPLVVDSPGLRQNSYSRPSWGSSYSLADMEQDEKARRLINQSHANELASIEARPDPYDQARQHELDSFKYELATPASKDSLSQFGVTEPISKGALADLEVHDYQADSAMKRDLQKLQSQERIAEHRADSDLSRAKMLDDFRRADMSRKEGATEAGIASREKIAEGKRPGKDLMNLVFGGAPTPDISKAVAPEGSPQKGEVFRNRQTGERIMFNGEKFVPIE